MSDDSILGVNVFKYKKITFLLIIYMFSLLVVFFRPLDVQQWQWADDALYFNNALSILKNLGGHDWLGSYNSVLLSKAPFFSVFIAFVIASGIPLRLAEFALFMPLPILFLLAVRPLKLPKWSVLYLSAICLLFIPIVGTELRLLRTNVFGAMSLVCLICLLGLFLHGWFKKDRVWSWSLGAGVAMGLAATTREEAIWLMVPSVLIFLILYYRCLKLGTIRKTGFAMMPTLVIGYLLPMTLFSLLNFNSYGLFSPSTRQSSEFKDFYSTLVSLEPSERQRFVPMPTKVREAAYKVSPHFRELKPFLEGKALDSIALNRAHFALNGWGDKSGREFFVSNFEFALTKAIFLSGRTTGGALIAFCRSVTQELDDAAKRGDIQQGLKGVGVFPPIYPDDYMQIIKAATKSLEFLISGESMHRVYILKNNPDLVMANKWNSLLHTWPGIAFDGYHELPSILFNVVVLNLGKYFYWLVIILGSFCLIKMALRKNKGFPTLYVLMAGVSLFAVLSFNGIIGILDTIGWPTLNWSNGYNAMGYFPFCFFVLIMGTILLAALKGDRSVEEI